MAGARDLPGDSRDLLRRLRLAEHDLGHPLPQRAVMVDRRIAEVGERQILQPRDGVVDRRIAAGELFQELSEAHGFHAGWTLTHSCTGVFGSSARGRTILEPSCQSSSRSSQASFSAWRSPGWRASSSGAWTRRSIATRPFNVVVGFATLVYAPLVGYFVAFHGDWTYGYTVVVAPRPLRGRPRAGHPRRLLGAARDGSVSSRRAGAAPLRRRVARHRPGRRVRGRPRLGGRASVRERDVRSVSRGVRRAAHRVLGARARRPGDGPRPRRWEWDGRCAPFTSATWSDDGRRGASGTLRTACDPATFERPWPRRRAVDISGGRGARDLVQDLHRGVRDGSRSRCRGACTRARQPRRPGCGGSRPPTPMTSTRRRRRPRSKHGRRPSGDSAAAPGPGTTISTTRKPSSSAPTRSPTR